MDKLLNKNICLYYYGNNHFLINLQNYIKINLKSHKLIYIISSQQIINHIYIDFNFTENNTSNLYNLIKPIEYTELDKLESELSKDFTHISTIIIDASYLINNIGKNKFIEFVCKFYNLLLNFNINSLTCYDFSNYLNTQSLIDEDILNFSYKSHDFRLLDNKIYPMSQFNLIFK